MIHQPIEPPRREERPARSSPGRDALRAMFLGINWPGVIVVFALFAIWAFCVAIGAAHFHQVFG